MTEEIEITALLCFYLVGEEDSFFDTDLSFFPAIRVGDHITLRKVIMPGAKKRWHPSLALDENFVIVRISHGFETRLHSDGDVQRFYYANIEVGKV